jgi:isoleucyl-tRNA synthetase
MTTNKSFPVPQTDVGLAQREEAVLELWANTKAFEQSVESRPESNRFVFYDGPPFATGLPHYGHFVASTIKDIVPRYWTMRGYRVERRFGWDTHGLPIEMLMEQKLGLSGPTSIREFGVPEFNEACRENVLLYTEEWRKILGRLGRWVDFDNDYKTMDMTYMESLWWVFRALWDKELVYKAFRVMPFSWRLSTSLSNFEANADYRDVQDPAITVAMPLVSDPSTSVLIWTTTPWTLPSNLAIAVGEDIEYVKVKRDNGLHCIVARARLEAVFGKSAEVVDSFSGSALVGLRYQPLFEDFKEHPNAFQIIRSSHVTTDDGTGLVHMAPDFGEDDYSACVAHGINVVLSVDNEGNFTEAVSAFAGQNIKAADPEIIRAIKGMGRLIKHDTIQHSYPFCYRSGTPLIYKAVPARFVRVSELKDRMIKHNQSIHWVPESVGQKRFGNWLADARDWNVSRNRFWGTPVPIWICDACEHEHCVGSIEELTTLTGTEIDDIHPHKVDHLRFPCTQCQGTMKRIPDVFDCWFESGAMPYAQEHYPFAGKARVENNFPAQFIAEGVDQTRGWFYTLLVLSTALFDKPPFQNCIVNGMVLAEDGSKMSKSKQNYPPPMNVLNEYGADALRAYLITSPVVRAEPLRFNEAGVREVVRTVLLPLQNAWSFFVQYANIDGFDAKTGFHNQGMPAPKDRSDLDRWILSVLQSLIKEVNEQMEGYFLYKVVPPTLGFIDDLTNWYIRRSRRRFWRSAADAEGQFDKACAYATLYEVLVTFSKVMAPILPFITESMYQNLVMESGSNSDAPESVHLCDFPEVDLELIDTELEHNVNVVREIVSMGRSLRERYKLKTRQPLQSVTIVHHDPSQLAAASAYASLIQEELNVKSVLIESNAQALATMSFKANFKRLGPKVGRDMKAVAQAIGALTHDEWTMMAAGETKVLGGHEVEVDDILVTQTPKKDVVIETRNALSVALDHQLNDALRMEGLAREFVSRLQRMRKEIGLEITDRINLDVKTDEAALNDAIRTFDAYIRDEVLADSLNLDTSGKASSALEIEGVALTVSMSKT